MPDGEARSTRGGRIPIASGWSRRSASPTGVTCSWVTHDVRWIRRFDRKGDVPEQYRRSAPQGRLPHTQRRGRLRSSTTTASCTWPTRACTVSNATRPTASTWVTSAVSTGSDPEGFPGCCNPTNVTLDARAVGWWLPRKPRHASNSTEKNGKLLTGDRRRGDSISTAKNMDVAVDSAGRIYVADNVTFRDPHVRAGGRGAVSAMKRRPTVGSELLGTCRPWCGARWVSAGPAAVLVTQGAQDVRLGHRRRQVRQLATGRARGGRL